MSEFSCFDFIYWRVISLCTFSPIFGPKGDLWRHAMGHEFHIFTIWVQNWVLRLKLSQCTNFHVSTFISWRVISLCTFSPIFGPKGDWWHHAMGHEFHIFTIWVQNWVLRLKLSQCTNFMFQRLFLHVSLVFEYLPLFWSQGRFMTSCKGTWISHFQYMSPELSSV